MDDWKYGHLVDLLGHIYSGRGGMPEIVELQKWLDERKASGPTPRTPDAPCASDAGRFQRHWFGPKSKCQRCGQARR